MEQRDNALVELVKKDPHCLRSHKKDVEKYPDAKPEDALLHLRTMATVAKIEQYARACQYNAGTGSKPSVLCASVIPEEIQEEIYEKALAELEKEDAAAEEEEEEEEDEQQAQPDNNEVVDLCSSSSDDES